MSVLMPVIRNICIDISDQKDLYSKLKKWRSSTSDEVILEDYYIDLKVFDIGIIGDFILIPKGFVFDGASIPKLLSNIYLPNGVLYFGSIVHDFIYGYGGLLIYTNGDLSFKSLNRSQADTIFDILNTVHVGCTTITKPAYTALKLFGWLSWNKCRKENKQFIEDFQELHF